MTPTYAIIGATGGIGAELVRQLECKANLFLGSRRTSPSVDATQSASVDAFIAAAVEKFGRLDGAVCLTGSILLKPAHQTTDEEFANTLAINTNAAFYMLRAAVKAMTEGGSIVLASTVATKIGLMNHEAIAAAKGAINGLVIAAAATYAPKKIRVNAVAPGLVRTPLTERLTSNEASLKASTAMHPLGRIGEPADVANAIAFLLAPANAWITGQILSVDGGLGSVRTRG